jgi:hypothetical protein
MQPWAAIPPLDEAELETLIGTTVGVPVRSNHNKTWWCKIKGVLFVTMDRQDAIITVTGHEHFGKPKTYRLSELRWRNMITEPALLAIAKARGSRAAGSKSCGTCPADPPLRP